MEWVHFDQSVVDAAIGHLRRRLSACVRVRGADTKLRAQTLTILKQTVIQTYNSAK